MPRLVLTSFLPPMAYGPRAAQHASPHRLIGVRMLFADAALSSAVVSAAAALAAFPSGALPGCTTADARADAVQKALATLATRASSSSPSIDLTSGSLVSDAASAAAINVCGAAAATLSQTDVSRVLSSAAAAYAATAAADFAALTAAAPNAVVTRAMELTALPLEAVAAAARVAAATAARLPAALASLASDANAVSSLIAGAFTTGPRFLRTAAVDFGSTAHCSIVCMRASRPCLNLNNPLTVGPAADWTNQLGAAGVATDAMAARLGLPALAGPAAARLSVRSSGVLTQCQVGGMADQAEGLQCRHAASASPCMIMHDNTHAHDAPACVDPSPNL